MKPCDGCQACCVFFTIPELAKPGMTPCRHSCAAGLLDLPCATACDLYGVRLRVEC